jgi:hypothetical protein
MMPSAAKSPPRTVDRGPITLPPQGSLRLIITKYPERFTRLGQTAMSVRTCREGLALINLMPFSCIFCDMGQLGVQESGFRFAKSLKDLDNAPPIFLMTEQVTVWDEQWAKRQGAEGLIPRSLEGVMAAISSLKSRQAEVS